MGLHLEKDKVVKIIDRTLPEIYSTDIKVSRLDLIDLCWMLKEIGVDLIEINRGILEKMGKLPAGIGFVYRINSKEDFDLCLKHKVKYCILDKNVFSGKELLKEISLQGIHMTAEFTANSMRELYDLGKLKKAGEFRYIDSLRITGISSFMSAEWTNAVYRLRSLLGKPMDICPRNPFFMATALAVEGIMNGLDCITASFLGFGREGGYAAIEEIVMAVKVLTSNSIHLNLSVLPALGKRLKKIAGIHIPANKPIVGERIFEYESGIHADGIEKNPSTYEPFEPYIVGQSRRLVVGKHSGRKSVMKKLTELGLECDVHDAASILESIRVRSAELKRELLDEEIREIYRYHMEGQEGWLLPYTLLTQH